MTQNQDRSTYLHPQLPSETLQMENYGAPLILLSKLYSKITDTEVIQKS